MNGTSTPSTPMSLKLLTDTRTKRVVFAEAGNDFVDFLLRILSLPVAKAVALAGKDAALGSVANLRGSIDGLKPYFTGDEFLKPATNLPFLSPPPTNPTCNLQLQMQRLASSPFSYVGDVGKRKKADGGGGVKGLVSYMVTDDLSVMPLSTASTMNEMNKLNVKRMTDLEEIVVPFTMANEVDEFFKTVLRSKRVLTDYFQKYTCRNSNCPPRTGKREVPICVDDDSSSPGPSGVKKERII